VRAFLFVSCLLIGVVLLGTAAAASAVPLRYCDPPGPSGAYLAASKNVGCGKARKVEAQMFSNVCIHKKRCQSQGFTCLSYWNGSYGHPFSFSHHGICKASGKRRIEFDGG
jgi:hypothetical protein